MHFKLITTAVICLSLVSCASWKKHPNDYRYVDEDNLVILNAQTAVAHDARFLEFTEYGAFSESIYLDEGVDLSVKSLEQFCKTDSEGKAFKTLYRPKQWARLAGLHVLSERKDVHDDLTLEVEVFVKKKGTETVALIIFRGTDFEQRQDWASNLRWFNRFSSKQLDQYDEVRILTPILIDEIEKRVGAVEEFIAVGHSLGGGLAHMAGYSSYKIRNVVAFDSSPVTGFYDLEGGLRRFNSHKLKVYRIYEHGEVLAYIRLAMKGLYPISHKNPKIVQIRFDLIADKNPVGQHSIRELTCSLYKQKLE